MNTYISRALVHDKVEMDSYKFDFFQTMVGSCHDQRGKVILMILLILQKVSAIEHNGMPCLTAVFRAVKCEFEQLVGKLISAAVSPHGHSRKIKDVPSCIFDI
jgi:hypothetical protein